MLQSIINKLTFSGNAFLNSNTEASFHKSSVEQLFRKILRNSEEHIFSMKTFLETQKNSPKKLFCEICGIFQNIFYMDQPRGLSLLIKCHFSCFYCWLQTCLCWLGIIKTFCSCFSAKFQFFHSTTKSIHHEVFWWNQYCENFFKEKFLVLF